MRTLLTTAAVAALALSAAACNKPANTTTTNATTTTSSMTNNSGEGTGNDAVSVAQDAASAVVGPISAATAGSLSAQAFVENAARSDMYETESSKLALERSKSAGVKKYATAMIAAHAKTTAELKGLVTTGKAGENIEIPVALDQRRQGLLDNLKSASDADFDQRYVDQQAAAHREAKILMDGYGTAGQSEPLKAMAKATAPKIAAHLNMVEGLDKANADKDKPAT